MGALNLRVVSNSQLMAAERKRTPEIVQNSPQITGLAGHIERAWQAAQTAKQPIEQQILRALRQRTGVYEPSDLALIRQMGGSEIFMMLTSAKCRGAESWLREILTPETDRPWGLSPSPMPDLPPPVTQAIIQAIYQEAMAAQWEIDDTRIDERLLKVKHLAFRRMKDIADKIALRHENKIADQFAEGGWAKALSDMIYDLVTFPAAFIKGPMLRMRKIRKWTPRPDGQWVPVVTDGLRLEWERRSPLDIFPAPAMRDLRYGNLIDRYRFTRDELQSLIGVPDYSENAIKEIIDRYGAKGYRSTMVNDMERARLELRANEEYDPDGTIEALNFWGSASGHMLKEWGWKNRMDVGDIQPHKEYQIDAWKTGGIVFKATLNPDPLGEKPYSKVSLEEIPGAFWGLGIPDLMSDSQRMCNAAARAISNNAAIASGPQVEVYVDRVADGETITKPYPWKLWQMTSDRTGNNQRAVQFTQPSMVVQELLVIYQHFERVSDNVTGFPNYTYGDSRVGGAGRTSSGLAQLMGSVGKGVRRVVGLVDLNTISVHVAKTYNWNMEHDPDPTIKGDLVPVAKGTAALLTKDMAQMRRQELLQATMNPLDAQIMGIEGRAELLREVFRAADLPVEKIIPDGLELQLRAASMPQPYELLGKTGPNSPSAAPGMSPGGGTPDGAETTDLAGRPPNGVEQREASLGYRDGGAVGDTHIHFDTPRRHFRVKKNNGALDVEEMDRDV